MNQSDNLLFYEWNLQVTLDNWTRQIDEEVNAIPRDQFLSNPEHTLFDNIFSKMHVEPLTLNEDEMTMEQDETKIDVSRNREEYSKLIYVQGIRIVVSVPFTGVSILWKMRPNQGLSVYPSADVYEARGEKAAHIELIYQQPLDAQAEQIKDQFKSDLERIYFYVNAQRNQVEEFNKALSGNIHRAIEARRQRLEKHEGIVEMLGIPLKRREQTLTYIAPTHRRKLPVQRPKVSTNSYELEPVLEESEYQHILEVMRSMSIVIERNPNAFATLGEEDVRTHFLIQLNGHYEGGATGETFNASGKTDILVRVGDRNIFIAECKFWNGPKAFNEAIDQLLGYLSWRDTKCALLIFNRNKDSSAVKQKMHLQMEDRPEHSQTILYDIEDDSKYIFVKESDPGREIIITTQIYDLPLPDYAPTDLSLDSFTTWLSDYGQAWQTGDADAVITLFSDDVQYYETPFDEPMIGRPAIYNYWREGAAESQADIHFTYQALAVVENKGLAQWQVTFTRLPSRNQVQLDGFLTADFNPTGQCTTFREWWHRRETAPIENKA